MTAEPQDPACPGTGGHGTRWAYKRRGCRCPAAVADFRANNARPRPSHAPERRRVNQVRPEYVRLLLSGVRDRGVVRRCEVAAAFTRLFEHGVQNRRIADIMDVSRRQVERRRRQWRQTLAA